MKCNQNNCEDEAIVIVYWPGKVPPPIYCLLHAIQATRILQVMGIKVATRKIEDNENVVS